MGELMRQTDGEEDMRRFETRGRAGRTGRTGDPHHVQAKDHPLPLDGFHGEVDVVRKPPRGMAVQADSVDPFEDPLDEAVPERGEPHHLLLKRRRGQLHRLPETDDPGDVLRGCPAAAFLIAAVHERRDPRSLPDVEQPHSLRPVELVRRGAQQIDVQLIHRKRQMAEGLDRVRMKTDPLFLRDPADLGDGLDRPDLVVRMHDGDEDGPVRDRLHHVRRIDQAVLIHGEISHPEPFLLQETAGLQNSVMFDRGGDDVVALLPVRPSHPLDREVIALRAAARKDDLRRFCTQKRGDLRPRLFHGRPGLLPEAMETGGIPVNLAEIGHHRLDHPLIRRRRRCIIHIDWIHLCLLIPASFSFPAIPQAPFALISTRLVVIKSRKGLCQGILSQGSMVVPSDALFWSFRGRLSPFRFRSRTFGGPFPGVRPVIRK